MAFLGLFLLLSARVGPQSTVLKHPTRIPTCYTAETHGGGKTSLTEFKRLRKISRESFFCVFECNLEILRLKQANDVCNKKLFSTKILA